MTTVKVNITAEDGEVLEILTVKSDTLQIEGELSNAIANAIEFKFETISDWGE